MMHCEWSFVPRGTTPAARDELEQEVHCLLAAWTHNGQLWGDQVWSWKRGQLRVSCWAPCADSLDPRHASEEVRDRLARVEAVSRARPSMSIAGTLGHRPSSRRWRTSKSLYMFTHMFDNSSPLCDGDTGAPVPLYAVPIGIELRRQLVDWMRTYRHLDSLWIGSGPLVIEAYRELASAGSVLSAGGRSLALAVARATGLPMYYYLMRYWGRSDPTNSASPSKHEIDRACPGCGGRWRRRTGGPRGLRSFPYRCARCRLVSQVAVNFDEPHQCTIGEWRAPVRRTPPRGRRRQT
jgi:predicted  nucleic acid-binding Zn ribbon protein